MKTNTVNGLLLIVFLLLGSEIQAKPSYLDYYNFRAKCKIEDESFKSEEGGCKEADTGMVWGRPALDRYDYASAEKYCETFKDGVWDQWRLPTKEELSRVAKVAKPHFKFNTFDFFWAKDNSTAPSAFLVSLAIEDDEIEKRKSEQGAVLCVRQGTPVKDGCNISDQYFVTADGGCKEVSSGLVWGHISEKKLVNPGGYCSRLIKNGVDRWRLPSIEELVGAAIAPMDFVSHVDIPKEIEHLPTSDNSKGAVVLISSLVSGLPAVRSQSGFFSMHVLCVYKEDKGK